MELSSDVTPTIPQLLVLSNSKLKKLLKLPIWSTTGLSNFVEILMTSFTNRVFSSVGLFLYIDN